MIQSSFEALYDPSEKSVTFSWEYLSGEFTKIVIEKCNQATNECEEFIQNSTVTSYTLYYNGSVSAYKYSLLVYQHSEVVFEETFYLKKGEFSASTSFIHRFTE